MTDDLSTQLVTAVAEAITSKVAEVRFQQLSGNQSAEEQIARAAITAVLRVLGGYWNEKGRYRELLVLADRIEQGDKKSDDD